MHCWKKTGFSFCKQKEPLFNRKLMFVLLLSSRMGIHHSCTRAGGVCLVALGAAWAQRTEQILVLCGSSLAGGSCGFFPVLSHAGPAFPDPTA